MDVRGTLRQAAAGAGVASWLAFASPALGVGPSFDCAEATAPLERMICADPALSALDVSLAEAYDTALARAPDDKPALLKAQRDWSRERAAACKIGEQAEVAARACLATLYETRIAALATPRGAAAQAAGEAALCTGVAEALRRHPAAFAGATKSLDAALGRDADAPVRFDAKGAPATKALLASVKGTGDYAMSPDDTTLYRLGSGIEALASIQGSAACNYVIPFRRVDGKAETIALPKQFDEGACGTSIAYGASRSPEALAVIAMGDVSLAQPSLALWWRRGDAARTQPWQACRVVATFGTRLDVSDHACAPGAPCATLAAMALTLARERDAAAGDKPPARLGKATLIVRPMPNAEFPLFGKERDGYSAFEENAPSYTLEGPGGPLVARLSHGTLGWRTNENYLVGLFAGTGAASKPLAGVMITKTRTTLQDVSVK